MMAPVDEMRPAPEYDKICSLGRMGPVMQSDTSGYAIAEVRPDSILDGLYYYAFRRPTKDSPAGGVNPRPVYGQIAQLHSVEPRGWQRMPANGRVVLVWWGLGAMCERALPLRAIELRAGEQVFIAASLLRPRADWIAALPTFDVEAVHRLYGLIYYESLARASLHNVATPPALMSAREYAGFYARLPVRSLFERNTAVALDQLILWADANPDLARKHPAAENVSSARMTRSSLRRH